MLYRKAERIISQVSTLYLKYGIKSVTMDDIARELGVSKKTLYEHFYDKADLVKKFILYNIQQIEAQFNEVFSKDLSAIETLMEISKLVNKFLGAFNHSITYDLQKYYPATWKMLIDYKKNKMFTSVIDNLRKGVEQGYYREDIVPEIIARIYVSRIEASMDFDFKNAPNTGITPAVVYQEMLKYHIRGIASKKGIEYFEKHIVPTIK